MVDYRPKVKSSSDDKFMAIRTPGGFYDLYSKTVFKASIDKPGAFGGLNKFQLVITHDKSSWYITVYKDDIPQTRYHVMDTPRKIYTNEQMLRRGNRMLNASIDARNVERLQRHNKEMK